MAEAAEAPKPADKVRERTFDEPAPETGRQRIRDYFSWRPMPWWVCFFGFIFCLVKFQVVYNDSECAVLGVRSPATLPEVKKAFRTLSMCTHPDRLRGRLGRAATAAEERRGELIFNRAGAAKESLTSKFKGKKKQVPCYQGEMETAILDFFQVVGAQMKNLGVKEYTDFFVSFFWQMVTFEAGMMNTILTCLWLAFCFRILKQLLGYLWALGLLRGVLALVTTVIIGPIPTLLNFLVLPCLRFYVFCRKFVADLRPEAEAEPAKVAATETNATESATEPPPMTAAARKAAKLAKEPTGNVLRQRKRPETEKEKEQKNEGLREAPADAPEFPVSEDTAPQGPEPNMKDAVPGGVMPEGMWKCINWTVAEPIRARKAAADAMQFDMLLILTKPIIPLFMLIAVGQVWNGLFSSIIVGHALRKWVPAMSYEAHHLLIMFFGAVHTILGVSAGQIEQFAESSGKELLSLTWGWSFKDVLCIMNMCLLGASFKAMSSLGNEPAFASSFAAGIALRITLGQDSIKGLSGLQLASGKLEAWLKGLGIVIAGSEEVVSYSGNGIGDCGGGPIRMLFPNEDHAVWVARIIKAWLMLLPLMATGIWLLRTIQAGKMLGRRKKTMRFVQRLILFCMGLLQCVLLFNFELNAPNGALGNFWVAMLIGCVAESLMATFEVRGNIKQVLFLALFIFI